MTRYISEKNEKIYILKGVGKHGLKFNQNYKISIQQPSHAKNLAVYKSQGKEEFG